MRSSRQLPAKVLKRIGQLRRLGPRGLARTAYVRALGPSIYSLTDPVRTVAARLYCERALRRAVPVRIRRLQERTHSLDREAAQIVRQEFGTGVERFVLTLEALLDLHSAGCAVPRLVAIDWTSKAITVEQCGVAFGEHRSAGLIDESCIALLEESLLAIHRAGYALGEIGEGDVVISPDGSPLICNLEHSVRISGLSRDMSIHFRDADRRRFNELFGTRLLTARRLRTLLSPNARIPQDRVHGIFREVYAPVVIRDDIRWGRIWNTDLGIGRWNFIMKEHLPIPQGGSVLDLGSNNGFNPLQMLRAGAASAVGIEIDGPAIEQAKFLKSAYEWLDNRSYDFRCIQGSQADLGKFDLPRFDIVTAFCSLYYLPEDEIRELARFIRRLTDTFVLQCNTDRLIDRGGQEQTYYKASLGFAVEVLEQAGFAKQEIIAPAGYSRPLVIGRAA